MKRTVIKIDEDKCNGCGNCITGCHEGALQLIDGKAVMISDLYCDGLGACIGECPVDAISFEEREAAPYDESLVMERLAEKGETAILAHLKHLNDHNEHQWVEEGIHYLQTHQIMIDLSKIGLGKQSDKPHDKETTEVPTACGCPGSMIREIKRPAAKGFSVAQPSAIMSQPSELRQFPVQLHLLHPGAGFLKGANLLLAADCTAFASGEFHSRYLKGKALAIACPKLDSHIPDYISKLTQMIDHGGIDTLTVLVMEVPCCSGLVRIARTALEQAERHIPLKVMVLSVSGELISEQWV